MLLPLRGAHNYSRHVAAQNRPGQFGHSVPDGSGRSHGNIVPGRGILVPLEHTSRNMNAIPPGTPRYS